MTTDPSKLLATFDYIPLHNPKNDFRLVVVEPSIDAASTLYCQVANTSLNTHQEYEALSYVWGTDLAAKPIQLMQAGATDITSEDSRGSDFVVTQNLEAALRALRLPDRPRNLWIDAICIDQNNIDERNEQVQLMDRIYRQCSRDMLWLGSETDKVQRAMGLVERLATNDVKLSSFTEEDWANIKTMIGGNPVWSRVWIIQELYFAPKISMFCRGRSLDWNVLLSAIEDNQEFTDNWLNSPGSSMFERLHSSFHNITTFQVIRHSTSGSQGLFDKRLIAVVLTFGKWNATRTVDKIYGLLNVADDAQGFPIDYKKTLEEISIDFGHHVISSNKSLLILSAALGDPLQYDRVDQLSTAIATVPSWVMDISKSIPSVSSLTQCGQTQYNACGMMKEPICAFSDDKRRLVLGGWSVDTIGFMNEVSSIADGETPRNRWIRDVIRWAPENGEARLYTPINETFLNAYWRTITADRKQDRRITSEDFEGPTWYERYQSLEERTVPDEQVVLSGWRFGRSSTGMFCMFPPAAKAGDSIVVFFGGRVPFLLRPVGEEEYSLVGEVYLHGFMDGQILMQYLAGGRLDKVENPEVFHIL